MRPSGAEFRTIWLAPDDPDCVQIIDQRELPHALVIADLRDYREAIYAISEMQVRGAPLIGATAAWAFYLAAIECANHRQPLSFMRNAAKEIGAARPTAVNLQWAVRRMSDVLDQLTNTRDMTSAMRDEASEICDEDVEICHSIGVHGLPLLEKIATRKAGETVNILTHCNAGALATVNWGTATSPMYQAHAQGMNIHVWVDETRPRNQGSQLTAWELAANGVPHTLIVDNAGGHLMQHGLVDICITGTDRTTRSGDVANKIGTYLKALAASDNDIPFYVALPSTTVDWSIRDGISDIPIEERDPHEVTKVRGKLSDNICEVTTTVDSTAVSNYAFDVTPARLVTGLITERGVCAASEAGLAGLFPELAGMHD